MKKLVQFSSFCLVGLSVMTVNVMSPWFIHRPDAPKELLNK